MEKMNLNIQMFASTNKTTNYELSQYVGADKPTYLGDYNSDMLKIDTQMKKNADDIASVDSKATTTQETATQAQSTATTAQETATGAQSTATNALNKSLENETKINNFNLTNIKKYDSSIGVQGNVDYTNITVAVNSDSSLAKIYGGVTFTNPEINKEVECYIMTDLRPKENITINYAGNCQRYSDNHFGACTLIIETTGKLTIKGTLSPVANDILVVWLTPCIYFLKNFGDTIN